MSQSKSKFDPSKSFEKLEAKAFNPDADFEVVDEKSSLENAGETITDYNKGISQGVPGYGLLQKAGNAIGSAVVAITPGEKRTYDEIYEQNLRADMDADKAAAERSPIANTLGNITGSVVTPGIKGSTGLTGVAQRVAGNAAISAADAGTRGEDLWDEAEAEHAAKVSGGVSGALEAIPYVGKGIKKLLPGNMDSVPLVNKVTSKVAGLNPLSKASSDEVMELLSDVEGRRGARSANFGDETMKVAKDLNTARKGIKDKVSDAYGTLEQAAMSVTDEADHGAAANALNKIGEAIQTRAEHADLYSPLSQTVLTRVNHIVQNGTPDEKARGLVWAGKALDEIDDPQVRAAASKWRMLQGRKALDNALEAKDIEKLPKFDRDLILDLRSNLNNELQGQFSGAADLKKADELYSNVKPALDEVFKPLTSKNTGKIDPRKLMSNLNDDKIRGKVFKESSDQLNQVLQKYEGELGQIPEVIAANKSLEKLQELARWNSKLDIADRSAGGPTGQGANAIMQALGAYSSGGLSLLALPITNPAAYTRLVDELAKLGEKELPKVIRRASAAMVKQAPQVATRLNVLGRQSDKGDEK